MRLIDKAMRSESVKRCFPHLSEDEIMNKLCPDELDCKEHSLCHKYGIGGNNCSKCWSQEVDK